MIATCLLAAAFACQQDELPHHFVRLSPRITALGSVIWTVPDDSTPATTDHYAMIEMVEAIRAQDTIGIKELIESRRVVLLEPGIGLKVINYGNQPPTIWGKKMGFSYHDVRVLEGKYTGRKLVVEDSYLALKIYDPLTAKQKAKIRAREEKAEQQAQEKAEEEAKTNPQEIARWKAKMQAEFQAEMKALAK